MAGDTEADGFREDYGLQTMQSLVGEQNCAQVDLVCRALDVARRDNPGGPVVFAARLLGISRSSLARFMKKWEINR